MDDNLPPAMNPRGGRTSAAMIAVILAFAATRIWVLVFAPVKHDELDVLAQMGFEQRLASSRNESFYDLHARVAKADAQQRQRAGGPPADPARQRVEYPPLAIAWIVLPTYFCDPVGRDGGWDDHHVRQYENASRCLLA